MKNSLSLSLILVSAAMLAACSAQNGTFNYAGKGNAESSEDLLRNDGSSDVALDPMQQHMLARKQVDPTELTTTHAYTKVINDEAELAEAIERDRELEAAYQAREKDKTTGFKDIVPSLISKETPKEEQPVEVANIESSTTPVSVGAPVSVEPSAGQAAVTNVRLGEHANKTRIVLDLNAPAQFTYLLQKEGRELVIDLPGTGWSAAAQQVLGGNHPLVKSYSTYPSKAGGTTLAVELSKPVKLTMSSALAPNDVYGNRIVFDVSGI